MIAVRIVALAKAVSAAERACGSFIDADTSELSQLDDRALLDLIQLASELRDRAHDVATAAAALRVERA